MSVLRLAVPGLLAMGAGGLPARAAAQQQGTPTTGPVSTRAADRATTELARRIDAVIDRPPFSRAHWGILVWDPASGRALYQRNADRHFIPASTLKLVVSAAAAHLLDPGFHFRTSVHAAGPVRDGTLEGDLVLYGRGDPMISGRYFPRATSVLEALVDSLAARGIRRVAGGIVADESHFDSVQLRADWERYDLLWWYAAPVGALGFNDNSIDFRVEPGGRVGDRARITGAPVSGFYTLDNRTRTVARGRPQTLDFDRVPGTNRIIAYGEIPLGAASRTEYVAVVDPARVVGTVFREILERRGIRVDRPEVRVVRDPAQAPAVRVPALAEHLSPPLPQTIGPILGNSQNWFAELLLKTLGKEVRGEGSWDAGLAVERDFLVRVVGIDSAAFVLRDGSGLSAGNLITPEALVRILVWARTSPRGELVRQALPVSGRSGSLRSRLTDLPGRVAAKSGYIGNVDSLSGYVTLADGREVLFSIVANASGLPSSRMKGAIDDIVRAIARVELS
ncbi:MAG TPA: D-alanyl-D-alanine carboxypeptidase/D-alanyl-D-alanine-endopeptidase [Longimicrobiaceae bacterium]|nr:D-alanyl-D-alanine carboxypeptidase/D-alanyl-D-alanine-endopeptidase [Longimicrobiaceae bacterium]